MLSNGERFRYELATAVLDGGKLTAFDGCSSVPDRVVGRIGSAAVYKSIRSDKIKRKFVVVTCHYDVSEWLEPNWVVGMATISLERRRLRGLIDRCERYALL